jgi:hypothetical protein
MNRSSKQDSIRRIAHENQSDSGGQKILWSRHGIAELVNEGWTRAALERSLMTCEIIEDYPTLTRPLPDCLILGLLAQGVVFHAVVAIDAPNDRLFIVTVYRPSVEEWENDWRTRKR